VGHQYVIETALAETDKVYVMIYDSPEVTRIPLAVRAQWIRELYPTVHVLEAYNVPSEVSNEPQKKREHEQYILHILNGRQVTHFFSSEFYGEHVSQALQAHNRQIDPERRVHPVSASLIRSDPYRYRHYMHPRVYRDLIKNIVILGAPSTGKTTLSEALTQRYNTVWMPEYGREYWEQHQINRRLSQQQLLELAQGHIQREEQKLLSANRFLFTDTNAITTLLFSLYYHQQAQPELTHLAEACKQRYALTFLCDSDIPYDDSWDRSGHLQRETMQRKYCQYLDQQQIDYTLLSGSLESRVIQVGEILDQQLDLFTG
jgi:NadR type nicotinamide-nucleotide adenylyltransferase